MRVVLDANVIIAAFASRGLCDSILETCLENHEIIFGEHLIEEIRRNLIKKIRLPSQIADNIICLLREHTRIVIPDSHDKGSCRDPDDVMLLGLATAAEANCIVTGDKDLLDLKEFRSIPILSPRGFSNMLHSRKNID